MPIARFLVGLLALLAGATSAAQDAAPIPPPLAPWVPWVLDSAGDERCPVVEGVRVCVWPSALALEVEGGGARFTLRATSDLTRMLPLPGGRGSFPTDVQLDGKRVPVLSVGGAPAVELARGAHVITGRIPLEARASKLQVPKLVGALSLRVGGRAITHPRREPDGTLFLGDEEPRPNEQQRLTISVYRRIEDAIPLRIVTRIELDAAGEPTELNLPGALLAGSRPIALRANLPAHLAKDGSLRVQVQAGSYRIELDALMERDPKQLAAAQQPSPWPAQEIWVFQADDRLRHVELSGAPQVDAARTDLASDWQGLPTFLLSPAQPLLLETRRRGEPEPGANRLTLERTLWLDLDGRGYTVRDQLRGELRRTFRIDLREGELGRATLAGEKDELITRHGASSGIELRSRDVELRTEWRLPQATRDLPAVGYSEGVEQLSAQLHLPPGYLLLGAAGVDRAQGTWADSWDLFDFFFVLLMALAVGKLAGPWFAAVALLALVLTQHDGDAPSSAWVLLLGCTALTRALPRGTAGKLARASWLFALAGLLLVLLPYAIQKVRDAIHLQLEEPQVALESSASLRESAPEPVAAPAGALLEVEGSTMAGGAVGEPQADLLRGAPKKVAGSSYDSSYAPRELVDPSAVVQTGPGVPSWTFRSYALQWSGPVTTEERLTLWLSPPALTRLWSLLCAVASLALLFALGRAAHLRLEPDGPAGGDGDRPAGGAPTDEPAREPALVSTRSALLVLLAGVAMLFAARAHAQALPSPELLAELRTRLLSPPACAPECVHVAELALTLQSGRLHVRETVHAGVGAVLRAPGPLAAFPIERIRIDGQEAVSAVRLEDGALYVRVPPGVRVVELEGAAPDSAAFTLALGRPLPARVSADATGYAIEGLHRDGTSEPSFAFRRELAQDEPASEQALTTWFEVKRELSLGLRFLVRTTVTRVGPSGGAVLLRIPLLPGESVHDSAMRVEQGSVLITIPADQSAVSFASSLEPRPRLELVAAEPVLAGALKRPYSEHWVVRPSTFYALSFEGIPPVARVGQSGAYEPSFRPFPGEKLAIQAARLTPASGASVTIDRAELRYRPGARSEETRLLLSLRASRGTTERVALPSDARLQSLAVNQQPRAARIVAGVVELPLDPGSHAIELTYERPSGMRFRYSPQAPKLSRAASNAFVSIDLPSERWLLFTAGPSWGPAVLFWGYALGIALLSLGLSRVPLSPLRAHQWLLLGLGFTQVEPLVALLVVGWLFALAYREKEIVNGRRLFNLFQAALVLFTFVALCCLAYAVHQGLLVPPDMQVQGMMSNLNFVQWYADRTPGQLPEVTVWSAPLWLYKGLMLLWALWLAASLVHWLRFGWVALRKGGAYRPNPNRRHRVRTRSIRGTPGPSQPPDGPAGGADAERARIS